MMRPLRVSAVGDISFEGDAADRPSSQCFADVEKCFGQSDVVIANLECALTDEGDPIVGKCTLRGTPGWAPVMKQAGVGIVSLANNHVMDYGSAGLMNTINALRAAGIEYVGAGLNSREAYSPLVREVAGRRLGLIARTAVTVSSPTAAAEHRPGVAFFDLEETVAAIRSCRERADLVLVLVHWGVEEYAYPSPMQRDMARQLIDAGAAAVIGHHPHVLQGAERFGSGVAAYSLGNFVFDEFDWSCVASDLTLVRQRSTLSADNRKGVIATLEWSADNELVTSFAPTRVDEDGQVRLDSDPRRRDQMDRLSAALRLPAYRFAWAGYAARREWTLRLGDRLSLPKIAANVSRVRPRHVRELWVSLHRSVRIVSERTTNPYE